MIEFKNSSAIFLIVCMILSSSICRDDELGIKEQESRLITALSGASMTSLLIEGGENHSSIFRFGSKLNYYELALRGLHKDFQISRSDRPILNINSDNDVTIFTNKINANSGVEYTGQLKVNSIPQWSLVYEEDFSEGWSNNNTTECGGVKMLGGYCQFAGIEVNKSFTNLPPHSYLRIQATFHFIDAWDTESGFMKINNGKDGKLVYAWIERYSAFMGEGGIDICGGKWPEGKFASPIDLTIPHKENNVTISFGSNIEQDPCDESFGVSGFRIYAK
jgi:hypothetical protein